MVDAMQKTKRNTLLSIGECMVELTDAGEGLIRRGFAGDTFNMAYYARQFLPENWDVEYFTALGDDRLSDEMLAFMQANKIGSRFVARAAGRAPGLYMVHLDKGERSFSYWRSQSAARQLADNADLVSAAVDAADAIIFSGITLAILDNVARKRLLETLDKAKAAGKTVAFDPNIRPRLWQGREEMLEVISKGARASNIVMPSFEDEQTYFLDKSANDTIERYKHLDVENVVLKDGAGSITLDFECQRTSISAKPVAKVVDTTGAGDSFNGVFLAQFLRGSDPMKAAETAATAAAIVITKNGALCTVEA